MASRKPHLRHTARSLPIALLRARETVMGSYREMLAKSGISEQKWRVLRVLFEGGPMEQTAIAEEACLLLPSLTRILTSLEKDGYVHRSTDVEDRRKTIVVLAEAGQNLIESHSEQSAKITAGIEQDFGPERLEQLLDLLEGLHGLKNTK